MKKETKNEFSQAFAQILEDKQLPAEVILGAIESAMASAYRRSVNASSAQEVEAKIDTATGKVVIHAEKEVVEDVQDERTEVTLEDARAVNPEAELGDMVMVESTPANFGRVAAQTARQVIQQRIREAERAVQLEYFERQVGEIIGGIVQAMGGRQGVTVGLDMKAEGMMPNNHKIPGERFRVHDRVRAVVLEVKDSSHGPQIILSRAHRTFLRRLLENEVPEIYHGVVEIRSIAREPGRRAKVAVSATQPGIDPVGACVGIRGVRIQSIVRELHDEKIDVIEWDADQEAYISKAISPARVTGVYLSQRPDAAKTATVVVTEDQLSLAIGRDGQNARLAAKLTGWRIDIKSLLEATGDALHKLQNDAELREMLPALVEEAPQIEAILAKKAEGRPLTPEEYQSMAKFMDRVERRTIEAEEASIKEEQERLDAIRAEIPAGAFELALEDSGIKEHIVNILTEVEYETVGDLMLTLKADPDKVLGLSGIGPKAIENIETVLAELTFPEPEPEPVEADAEEADADAGVPESAEDIEETEQVEVEDAAQTEKDAENVSMEDLFKLQPEMVKSTNKDAVLEDEIELEPKKKKKKKKKYVKYEYDDELGEVVAHKRRKGDADWEEDW
ncbi:MAG: transcription termination factor NusA [Anaerolineales bacterium]|nr:transcription termination factor NusA [Anaerolineales bacterium]